MYFLLKLSTEINSALGVAVWLHFIVAFLFYLVI